jgi:GNAT superfamily N-acetyltransferase
VTDPSLRPVDAGDLASINDLVLDAIRVWPMADGVRQRVAPSYCYDVVDLDHMRLFAIGEEPSGMIALEAASASDAPATPALLLHGIYVRPGAHGAGLGRCLVDAALDIARSEGAAGLLVKAQRSANGFFEALGFERLPVVDAARDYPHRYWKTCRR